MQVFHVLETENKFKTIHEKVICCGGNVSYERIHKTKLTYIPVYRRESFSPFE